MVAKCYSDNEPFTKVIIKKINKMTYILNNKTAILFAIAIFSVLITGCDNAEYSVLGTHAYIAEALDSHGSSVTVEATGQTTTTLNVKSSDKAKVRSKFKLVPDQETLDEYSKISGTEFVMLPEEYYQLPEEIIIEQGKYDADEIKISVKPFSDEMFASGKSYALPLRLESLDNEIPIMGKSGRYVLATRGIIKFSAPILSGSTPVSVDMSPGELVLNEFTVEVRFQMKEFYENQAFFNGGGSGNDQVYIRLEDPIGTYNLIQIVGKNTYLNAITPVEKNKWQHIAIAFDGSKYLIYINGKLDAQKEVAPGPVAFKKIEFASSGTSWFRSDCLMSEMRLARIWSVCRTELQIQNNMTVVSPEADGLKAYWKMNEGSGNIFEDATGNGYTAKTEANVKWIHEILSTDEKTPW